MRVLFYNHTGLASGAERVLLMILTDLNRDRFDPLVVCPEGDLAGQVREIGIPVVPIGEVTARFTWRLDEMLSSTRSVIAKTRAFRQVVAEQAPDVIHANSVRAGVVASLATMGMSVRVIWHVHDMMKPHPFSTGIRLLAATRGLGVAVAVSKATARSFEGRLLRAFGSRAPVKVIYNGIENERFRPDADDRARKRAELGVSERQIALGIIGQISPRKGQLELVQAFADVVRKEPNARLFIAGVPMFHKAGEYFAAVQREVERLGLRRHVRFLGHCSDTPSLLRALDAVVINSRIEPFCLVALEALACATPVLAASVDGIVEIIRDGENGYLLRTHNTAHLTDRLLELIANPAAAKRVAEQGRRDAIMNFGTDRLVRDFETLYAAFA